MVRINFSEELHSAENSLVAQGAVVRVQLERVMHALVDRDAELAEIVVAEDDRVDDIYLATHTRILNLLALQAPVASDLRLVSAILHSNMHLERMGDLCVNIAKFVLNQLPYGSSSILDRLSEMGTRAAEMLDSALLSFTRRDIELAEELPVKDTSLDVLNRGMLTDLKELSGSQETLESAINLILVARYLERFGDHAVDIGEQVYFLVTGIFREFTDASHPQPASSREIAD